jgi:ubiquinone/menaquinone biosynthesis C-methylase UbiE
MFNRSAHLYDIIYSFKDYAAEAALILEIVEARHPRAQSLLDVACGTGKHLEHFQERFEIEGLDFNEKLLEIARKRLPNVPLHLGDYTNFSLGRTFDVVTCLFSAIGSAPSVEAMDAAVAAMARHLAPGGLLLVEPWIDPSNWKERMVNTQVVEEPELHVVRMNGSHREGNRTRFEFHYLVGTPDHIEHFTEIHNLILFTREEYNDAFVKAGLSVDFDSRGLIGRGLYIGSK